MVAMSDVADEAPEPAKEWVAQSIVPSNGVSLLPKKQEQLRVALGLPPWLVRQLVCNGTFARKLLDAFFAAVVPLEIPLLWLVRKVPKRAKRAVMVCLFWLLRHAVKVHRALPARVAMRGLSDSLSSEAHILNTLGWWVRLMPLNVRRIRFGLHMLSAMYPPLGYRHEVVDVPERGVRGIWLHSAPADKTDPPVLLWIFGGAFFGGSAADNIDLASRYARELACDVFLAGYRVCPEHTIEDAQQDGCRAYEWLLTKKSPEKVVVMGISSGGGVAVRLLQLLGAPEEERRAFFFGTEALPQPAGAVLIGPWLTYTLNPTDKHHSLIGYQEYDMIVTERVMDCIQPQLAKACRGQERKPLVSPIFHDVKGFCPTFVSYSSHEACMDDAETLVKKLQEAACEVESVAHPYLFHVFQLFAVILPEGQKAEAEIWSWIRRRGRAWAA